MFSRSLVVLFALFFVFGTSFVLASEIKEMVAENGGGREGNQVNRVRDRVLCIDGLKVFQTIAFGHVRSPGGSGAAVANIQLYEEKNGNVVPVRCK